MTNAKQCVCGGWSQYVNGTLRCSKCGNSMTSDVSIRRNAIPDTCPRCLTYLTRFADGRYGCLKCGYDKAKVEDKPTSGKIKSDGGSTTYFDLPEHATELRHLISYKSMSKARGDVFKACYRLGEKEGTDVLYDLNKMKFFVEDLIEMYHRGEHL